MEDIRIQQFRLIQALQDNMSEKRRLTKSGRLEPSRLAHKGTSDLIFSQKVPDTGKNYKCDLLLDVSGSMSGDRIKNALNITKSLIKLFNGIIDFRIVLFGEGFRYASVNEILSCKDPRRLQITEMGTITIDGIQNIIPIEGGHSSIEDGTLGTYALKASIDTLSLEKGEKFVVYITDGHSGYSSHSVGGVPSYWDVGQTTEIIQYADDLGIKILPIEIASDGLDRFANKIHIKNASEIDKIYSSTIDFIEKNFK